VIPLPKKQQKTKVNWFPQKRQLTCLEACGLAYLLVGARAGPPVASVIGYGGAAGGGKSDALIGIAILAGAHFPGISIAYFRREYPQLEGLGGAILRSHELMSSWAHWNGSERRWTFPNGSRLQFCHAKDELDVHSYQSQQFDIVLIDEATQFTRYQYRYLLTRNRATKDGITPFMVLATNPGGPGHSWYKVEFADLPHEVPTDVEVEPGQFEKHIFIPAKLEDNKILETRDPAYRKKLENSPETTRRQLLEGDWSAFEGQYFASWRQDIHVIPTPKDMRAWLESTRNHRKFRCLDYGLDCTACYWVDVASDGRLTVYRELYKPNLILSKAARTIMDATTDLEQIAYTVASPDLWNRRQDTGASGVDGLKRGGWKGVINEADDRRVAGWEHMAEWIEPYDDPNTGKPASNLVFFDCCGNAIRQIPMLIRDANNPNDVSGKVEDHAGEAIRYGLMSQPKPAKIEIDPLESLAQQHPPWTTEYQILSQEVLMEDPKREVGLEDLEM
jgi:phage terminase large subunit